MTGNLDLGLNLLKLSDGSYGGCLRGNPTIANQVEVRNIGNTWYGSGALAGLNANQNITLAATKTVDGVDISEIAKPAGGLYLNAQMIGPGLGDRQVLLDTIISGFTDEIEDTANHKITVTRTGLYLIAASVGFNAELADAYYHVMVRKAGLTWVAKAKIPAAVTGYLTFGVTTINPLTANDDVDLWVNLPDNNSDIFAGLSETFLVVQFLR